MAVNPSNSMKIAAAFGKRIIVSSSSSSSSSSTSSLSSLLSRRSVHASVYDKNVDDHVRPQIVHDDIIQAQSDKYWAPNPNTGVFGPAAEGNSGEKSKYGYYSSGDTESVLEQKTFFRTQEDLDKPEQA